MRGKGKILNLVYSLINSFLRLDIRYFSSCQISFILKGHTHIPHPIGIVIGKGVVVGENVTIMQNVTIGVARLGAKAAPIIGNNVFIGAGAVVVGDINVGDGIIIKANDVVTKSRYA